VGEPVCIGLDLAWGERNRTGGAVLVGGRLAAWTGLLTDNAAILDFVAAHLPADRPAIVAIDAPLRVPNLTGRRACDHEVSLAWGRFEAGAYPANRTLLARNGAVRGEVLAAALRERFEFVEQAPIPLRGAGRYLCEVFPHPAHVALFDLDRTLKYKRKPGRSSAQIRGEFQRYQVLLASLTVATPPLLDAQSLLTIDATERRGQALQAVEEALDALTCAYVAWYAWWHGPAHQTVYGNVADGHILVPQPNRANHAPIVRA
jgi:predicted RNase H-like nuclease